MSSAHTKVIAALSADPVLQEQVLAAATPEARAALLSEAGLELPTAEEIAAAELPGISGGGSGPYPTTGCAGVGGAAASIN